MIDKKVIKLKKTELLELLVELSEENDKLKEENKQLKEKLESKDVNIQKCGSIAEAVLQLYEIFDTAQKVADCYIDNVKKIYTTENNIDENLDENMGENLNEQEVNSEE